jgi:hypothetical protein
MLKLFNKNRINEERDIDNGIIIEKDFLKKITKTYHTYIEINY